MIKYETVKGIVSVEIDKHNRPTFLMPQGMHGSDWGDIRDELHVKLKKDRPNVVLPKKRFNA